MSDMRKIMNLMESVKEHEESLWKDIDIVLKMKPLADDLTIVSRETSVLGGGRVYEYIANFDCDGVEKATVKARISGLIDSSEVEGDFVSLGESFSVRDLAKALSDIISQGHNTLITVGFDDGVDNQSREISSGQAEHEFLHI